MSIESVKPIIEVVKPLMSPEEAKKQWETFENLKKQLLVDDDYQLIGGKRFIKRSGFRKVAVFFGINDKILREERMERPDESFVWRMVVEAMAPNGRTSVGVGACDSRERFNWAHKEHDCYATAHTRAKSRAISDMIAGGIVSAEEVEASSPERHVDTVPRSGPLSEAEAASLAELPWIESRAAWLPEGTLYLFGDTPGSERLVEEMHRTPNLQIVMNGLLYQFKFGKGDGGSETFINAMPVGEERRENV